MRSGYYNDNAVLARWSLNESTAPAAEPLSLSDAKEHLRVTHTDEDTYITSLVLAAREWCETYCNSAFINRTYVLSLDKTPKGRHLQLPRPPLFSVTSVQYYDSTDTQQTFSADDYRADTASKPGRLILKESKSWPETITDRGNAMTVTYVAGYGAAASNVPSAVKHAVKIMVKNWYDNREPIVVGTSVLEIPMSAKSLLDTVREPEL